jgi:rare lipoprotein A
MKKKFLIYSIYGLFIVLFLVGCSSKPKVGKTYNAATMKPYKVMGKRYTPKTVSKGDVSYGVSSWYGPKFHGRKTSNGEIYNMYAHTAAHTTWPMNTMVKVTNLNNDKSTVVRINDRGPFVKNRIIDCSYVAGKRLGLDKSGIAKVKLEVLGTDGSVTKKVFPKPSPQKVFASQRTKSVMQGVNGNHYRLQVGAFSRYDGAQRMVEQYKHVAQPKIQPVHSNGRKLYKVVLDGFRNREALFAFKEKYNLTDARVIVTN